MNTFEKIAHLAAQETLEKYAGREEATIGGALPGVGWIVAPALADEDKRWQTFGGTLGGSALGYGAGALGGSTLGALIAKAVSKVKPHLAKKMGKVPYIGLAAGSTLGSMGGGSLGAHYGHDYDLNNK